MAGGQLSVPLLGWLMVPGPPSGSKGWDAAFTTWVLGGVPDPNCRGDCGSVCVPFQGSASGGRLSSFSSSSLGRKQRVALVQLAQVASIKPLAPLKANERVLPLPGWG